MSLQATYDSIKYQENAEVLIPLRKQNLGCSTTWKFLS
jgi:hypothetical protein